MDPLVWIIGTFVLGLVLMFVELFLPGAVIGTIGLALAAGSVIWAFATEHPTAGTILLVVGIAWIPIFFLLWKNVAARFFALRGGESGFRPSTTVTEDLVGLEGVTTTPLRPSGLARLDSKRRDVVTRGEMLDKGVTVKVIEVSGNRIVVKRI